MDWRLGYRSTFGLMNYDLGGNGLQFWVNGLGFRFIRASVVVALSMFLWQLVIGFWFSIFG